VLAAAPALAARPVPFLAGHVVDEAGLVPPDVRARLEQRLIALERSTGAQVAVLLVESLQGEPLEAYTLKVAETWQLGGRERDDGVLLFVARRDRKMRLEVGYGLEDRLTDLRSRRILDEVIAPRFKAGDFGGGVDEGVRAVEDVIRGGEVANAAPLAPVPPPVATAPWWVALLFGGLLVMVFGLFIAAALLGPAPVGWILYVFLAPFHFAFPAAYVSPTAGVAWLACWAVGFPIARWLLHRGKRGERLRSWHASSRGSSGPSSSGSSWSSGGSSGSSWSSSGSSGSSFSGGGGSFGGGGASSSW
jgi:uncharacterized protein